MVDVHLVVQCVFGLGIPGDVRDRELPLSTRTVLPQLPHVAVQATRLLTAEIEGHVWNVGGEVHQEVCQTSPDQYFSECQC